MLPGRGAKGVSSQGVGSPAGAGALEELKHTLALE